MTTDREPTVPECAGVQEDLAEFALGSLAGRQRSVVLAHLGGCPRCAEELEELSLVADAMLSVAPVVDPPVGFETRLFDRLGIAPRRRFVRLRRAKTVVFAAAAGLAGVGFGAGWLVAGTGSSPLAVSARPAGGTFASAQLAGNGQNLGVVSTYGGSPAWILMILRDASTSGEVQCYVTLSDGSTVKVGSFWLKHGYGGWSSPLSVPAKEVTGAMVIGSHGQVLASATLRL
jgi:hypothetical protein